MSANKKRGIMSIEGRKLKILNIIIENYMQTGEPVGSRTISKHPELNISSATVRNEMADLEEMGFITQPHTSAGRIPTDLGYRYYVDNLLRQRYNDLMFRQDELKRREEDIELKSKILDDKFNQLEKILHNLANRLADSTNYTTLITAPSLQTKIKFIQISKLDEYKLIIVCVTEGNIIKNQIININDVIKDEEILKLNLLFNTTLTGTNIDNISLSDIKRIQLQAPKFSDLISFIIEKIIDIFLIDEDLEIYTGGTTNILKYPELSQTNNLQALLTEIVEKNELSKLMANSDARDGEIQVYIGNENKISYLNDCSVVTMNFDLDDGVRSTIGIIGPKRMDYDKVLRNLEALRYQIRKIFEDR